MTYYGMLRSVNFLYLLRSYFVCLTTKSVFVLGEERAIEQQRLNSRRLLKKVSKRKDTPMSAEGLSHSLRWVRAKLADKQQFIRLTKSVFVLGEARAIEQQRLN